MYQQAAAGGHFDYCPRLRDEHDKNYPGVQKVSPLPAAPYRWATYVATRSMCAAQTG
jgi:hypothetical protein